MTKNQILKEHFIKKGFILESENDEYVIVYKKKQLKVWLLIVSLIIPIAFIAYLIYYNAILKDERIKIQNGKYENISFYDLITS